MTITKLGLSDKVGESEGGSVGLVEGLGVGDFVGSFDGLGVGRLDGEGDGYE